MGDRRDTTIPKSLLPVGCGMGARTDANESSFGRLALLALTFIVGYVLGSRRSGPTEEWQEESREPTEITIDGEQGNTPEESSENEE